MVRCRRSRSWQPQAEVIEAVAATNVPHMIHTSMVHIAVNKSKLPKMKYKYEEEMYFEYQVSAGLTCHISPTLFKMSKPEHVYSCQFCQKVCFDIHSLLGHLQMREHTSDNKCGLPQHGVYQHVPRAPSCSRIVNINEPWKDIFDLFTFDDPFTMFATPPHYYPNFHKLIVRLS